MMANGNGNGNGKPEVLRANSFLTCGWKPMLSWVCVFSVFWITCIMPMINSICQLKGIAFQLPSSTDMPLGEVLMAAFGMGGIHTYDRSRGIIGPSMNGNGNGNGNSNV